MGDLIVMTRPQAPAKERAPTGASAEILFFTGVRYYRMTEEVRPQTAIQRRRSELKKTAEARRSKRLSASSAPASA